MRYGIFAIGFGFCVGGCSCGADDNTATQSSGTASGATGGGGSGGGVQVSCVPGLKSIALTPADSTVVLDGTNAPPVTFTATGSFDDDTDKPIASDKLVWTATRDDDTPPGTIVAGVLTPYSKAGGFVDVTASDTCVTGATTVHFVLDVTVGQPSDPNAWDADPVTGGTAPALVYPSDQTRFPRNLYRTLFQWRSQGFTEFRLIFDGPSSV
jgi:hypothetical protein